MVEQKLLDVLLYSGHFWTMVGIFCILYLLRTIKPVSASLFSEKWRWIIPLINLSLSSISVFGLRMTNANEIGMKIVIVVLITAVTTYAYELMKPILNKVSQKLFGISLKSDG